MSENAVDATDERDGPLPQARYFREQEARGLSHGLIARRAGVGRTYVCKRLKLLTLPADVQRLAEGERLSFTTLYLLAELGDPATQRRLARQTVRQGWSTRELEAVVAREVGRTPPPRRRTYRGTHPDAAALAEALAESLSPSLGRNVDVRAVGHGRFEFRVMAAGAEDAIRLARSMGAVPVVDGL